MARDEVTPIMAYREGRAMHPVKTMSLSQSVPCPQFKRGHIDDAVL
jgi:hypothetical protein